MNLRKRTRIIIVLSLLFSILAVYSFFISAFIYKAYADETQEIYREEDTTSVINAALSERSERILISEVMIKNRAAVMTTDGTFPDWIELYNPSETDINLKGWILTDGKNRWSFPSITINSYEFLVIEAKGLSSLSTDFALSEEDSLTLLNEDEEEICHISDLHIEADHSLVYVKGGKYESTAWSTPGFENSIEGYEAYCDSILNPPSDLIINEVCNANNKYRPFYGSETCDWIELKNNSDREIEMSDYYLSDKNSNKRLWQLPTKKLSPGELVMIYCMDGSDSSHIYAPFSLSVPEEGLWLTGTAGRVVDAVYLHNIPVDGSCGRVEGKSGFFYFETPTPGENNADGYRYVTAAPIPSVKPMTYDGVKELKIELFSEEGSTIYYTLDSTLPDIGKALEYSGPIVIDKTTILRTFAVNEASCRSPVKTYSYILNENHTIPVLSLVVDSFQTFQGMYFNQQKNYEIPGVLSLFENREEQFNNACGVQMKGWTSLHLPKKSLGVYFRGSYGDGDVKRDLFYNGVQEYSSLSIRAGQDYTFTVVRNELFQNLCKEISKDVLTQSGKYCALYINGEYWGLYCLKENVNEHYFASLKNVDADTVLTGKGQVDYGIGLREAIEYSYKNDMTVEENFDSFCTKFNIDSLIDWIIMEGYSGNSDTVNNIRYFSSPAYDGGRWQMCYYDLDWGFSYYDFAFSNVIGGAGNPGYQMTEMIKALMNNSRFREKFLIRFSSLIQTTLSNENVLGEFDKLIAGVESEVARDRERWNMTLSGFYHRIEEFKNFVIENDYDHFCIEKVCSLLKVTPEERLLYFGEG